MPTCFPKIICGKVSCLFLELVVHDEHGKLGTLRLTFRLRQLQEFALNVLL